MGTHTASRVIRGGSRVALTLMVEHPHNTAAPQPPRDQSRADLIVAFLQFSQSVLIEPPVSDLSQELIPAKRQRIKRGLHNVRV